METPPRTTLLACDQQQSVLLARSAQQSEAAGYSPYGHRRPRRPLALQAFNGQLREPATGHYLLGNGYRAYNPVLMRFNSPDSLSPFGLGGLNPYTYCVGDPINRRDPNGHFSVGGPLGLLGIGLGLLSFGVATPFALAATALGVAATTTDAAMASSESGKSSGFWVAIGLGALSLLVAGATVVVAKKRSWLTAFGSDVAESSASRPSTAVAASSAPRSPSLIRSPAPLSINDRAKALLEARDGLGLVELGRASRDAREIVLHEAFKALLSNAQKGRAWRNQIRPKILKTQLIGLEKRWRETPLGERPLGLGQLYKDLLQLF